MQRRANLDVDMFLRVHMEDAAAAIRVRQKLQTPFVRKRHRTPIETKEGDMETLECWLVASTPRVNAIPETCAPCTNPFKFLDDARL